MEITSKISRQVLCLPKLSYFHIHIQWAIVLFCMKCLAATFSSPLSSFLVNIDLIYGFPQRGIDREDSQASIMPM